MSTASTKEKLANCLDDIEKLSKELFNQLATAKSQRGDSASTSDLLELLIKKDNELQDYLQTAAEQGVTQTKICALKSELEQKDNDIKQLQKNLKEGEAILATAIYQAKKKLECIKQANERAVSSEELIKYAHRISASNSVAAPATWAPGDRRRPYPTDIDMRMGWLGQLAELPIGSQYTFPESLSTGRANQFDRQQSGLGSGWQPDLSGAHAPATPMNMEQKKETTDDVEVMSTDSSSSSSSDE